MAHDTGALEIEADVHASGSPKPSEARIAEVGYITRSACPMDPLPLEGPSPLPESGLGWRQQPRPCRLGP